MNTEQETNIRMEENELNLGDILQTVLANWYWFVLSVVVCAGTAFLYLKWAQGIYPDGFGTDQGRCEGRCDERVGRFRGSGAFRYEAECG